MLVRPEDRHSYVLCQMNICESTKLYQGEGIQMSIIEKQTRDIVTYHFFQIEKNFFLTQDIVISIRQEITQNVQSQKRTSLTRNTKYI